MTEKKEETKSKEEIKENIKEEKKETDELLENLGEKWPEYDTRGSNLYLFWDKRKDSKNHGHVFFHENHNKWYYNIKCNNNKGNDRIRHRLVKTKTPGETKTEIRENWREECPEFIQTKMKKAKNAKKAKKTKKTVKAKKHTKTVKK